MTKKSLSEAVRTTRMRILAWASWSAYPLFVIVVWQTLGFALAALMLIIAGTIASGVFLVLYRPFDLRSHGPAGKNLLVMTWSTFLLFGLTILFDIISLPQWLTEFLSLVAIGGIVFAIVHRIVLWQMVSRRDRLGALEREERP